MVPSGRDLHRHQSVLSSRNPRLIDQPEDRRAVRAYAPLAMLPLQ